MAANGAIVFNSTGNRDIQKDKKGLMFVIPKVSYFKTQLVNQNVSTRTIIEQDSLVFVGSYDGHKIFEREILADFFWQMKNLPAQLYAADKDKNGNLWFGTESCDIPLSSYLPKEQKVINYHLPRDISKGKPRVYYSIEIESVSQHKWLGSEIGLWYLPVDSNHIIEFKKYNDFKFLHEVPIYSLNEQTDGIWVGSTKGLSLLHPRLGIIKHYTWDKTQFQKPDLKQIHSYQNGKLPEETVTIKYIYVDNEGLFWLATQNSGLLCWNPKTDELEVFSMKDGLPNNRIHAIYEDKFGHLWMSSDRGISRMHKKTKEFRNYFMEDGTSSNEFNFSSSYQSDDGRIYFGGINGITSFYPKEILEHEVPKKSAVKFYLSDFQTFGESDEKPVDKLDILKKEGQIVLEPTNVYFALAFSLLDYNNIYAREYAFKIDGFNKNWSILDKNRIRINKLPPGSYTLRVRVRIRNGKWLKEIQLPIIIQAAFYETWWFYALLTFIAVLLVYWYIRQREHRLQQAKLTLEQEVLVRTEQIAQAKKLIEKQVNELKNLDEVKTRFFTNVSHELRTPLTLILAPLEQIWKQCVTKQSTSPELIQMVLRNSKQLKKLVDELLEFSKLEADKIKLNNIFLELHPFILRLFEAYHYQAGVKNLNYQLEYTVPQGTQVMVDSELLEKIINNLLSNALKAAPEEGKILLKVTQEGNNLHFFVWNNGQEIHPNDLKHIFERYYQSKQKNALTEGGTGIGLAMVYEFVQLMGGTIDVKSSATAGTAFELILPLDIRVVHKKLPKEEVFVESLVEPQLENVDSNQLSILVVEDNLDMQNFLKMLLQTHYTVYTANNGKEALLHLATNATTTNLIISDVMMPVMDGFALLDQLKSHPQWCQLPVVLLTARTAQQDKLHALNMGVDDYEVV